MTAASAVAMAGLPDGASKRWQTAHQQLGALVEDVWGPGASIKPTESYGAHGWQVRRPEGAFHDPVATTFDPDHTIVCIKEQSNGMSLYLMWAGEYTVLDRFRDDIAPIGLKLRRGCIKWGRKADCPVDALRPILEHIRDTDGA